MNKLNFLIRKYHLIVIAFIIILVVVIVFFTKINLNKNEEVVIENIIIDEEIILKAEIKGAVNKPGVYEFKEGERVEDLINKASGLTENADTSVTNLSKKLEDGMVIIIYTYEEVNVGDSNINNNVINEVIDDAKIENNNDTNNSIININTANVDELMTLNGIGESRAKAIIEYRNSNGPFANIEEITNVKGIGQAIYEKIKAYITV